MEEKKEGFVKRHGEFFSSFGFKCIAVFIMVLIFQIPMAFIRNLINDRIYYHDASEESILVPKGGQPELQGVLVAIPYDILSIKRFTNGEREKTVEHRYIFVTPETFTAQTEIEPEMLRRGIFEIPVFNCDVHARGAFPSIEADSAFTPNESPEVEERVKFEDALLLVGISNKKILTSLPEIQAGGEVLRQSIFTPDIQSPFTETVYYDLGGRARSGFEFEMTANIQGGKTISLTPHAAENTFVVRSNWKTPKFAGGWLPTKREIGEDGFSAEWNIPGLSTNFPKRWTSQSGKSVITDESSVSASFFQSVDNYQKSMRSAKYSILFLLVPFIALLVFEAFSKMKIHPIQYALIGFANIVFYLLLLSISEHIPFNAAYWIASAAISLLMLFYGAAIFNKFAYGAFFAAVNFICYVFLFGTLQAEDYALLLGSIGIFAVVAALMILTRKIDWYKLN